VKEMTNEITSDKPATPGHQDLHDSLQLFFSFQFQISDFRF
jgi:hypothetical protein